jgi:hypothetical protein
MEWWCIGEKGVKFNDGSKTIKGIKQHGHWDQYLVGIDDILNDVFALDGFVHG